MTGDRTPLRERLAEALAVKFTSPKRGKATEETGWEEPILDTPADRLDKGMGVVFVASDGINSIRSVTPAEAADAVLPVVEEETAALRERAEQAEAAVQRVRALHNGGSPDNTVLCVACCNVLPCPTLAALEPPKETPQ